MAAALMTLFQATLLPKVHGDMEAADQDGPVAAGEAPGAPGLQLLQQGLAKGSVPSLGEDADPMSDNLQQLVIVAAKLSNIDSMLEEARQAPPLVDPEAQRWQQVSMTALQWSRKALSEKLQALLQGIRSDVAEKQQASQQEDEAPRCFTMPCDTSATAPSPPVDRPACLGTTSASSSAESSPNPAPTAPPGEFLPPTLEPAPAAEEAELLGGAHAAPPEVGSLRSDLERLREFDPGCCLIVRRIKKLGLESGQYLREHFELAGSVREVLVAHSFEKPSAKRRNGRIRPAAIGFVAMASEADAAAALLRGQEQVIGEAVVDVQLIEPFESLEEAEQALKG